MPSSSRARAALWSLSLVTAVVGIVLGGGGCQSCGTSVGPTDAGTDPNELITCVEAAECPADVPECSFGVCKRPCAANDGCINPNTYCDVVAGYCTPGCRDSSTCEAGTVCSGGACVTSQGCASKCDCGVGQVCVNGSCQDPPPTCTGPQDCGRGPLGPPDDCEDYACNAFSSQCFDPDPTPCTGNNDCIGRPGCAGGCTCTGAGNCVPEVACTVANEASTCGAGFFCDDNGACQALTSCTQENDCGAGLTCNLGTQLCERTRPCAASTECTVPPNTYCNNAVGFCAVPLCNNGGLTCNGNETCTADGRCVPAGTGDSCTGDAQCPTNQYCAANGQCAIGCRDNASCAPGQSCNGSHACVGGGGGGGGLGANCRNAAGDADDSLCQVGMFCGLFTGTCQESCPAESTNCPVDGCCPLTGQQCCSIVLFVGVCQSC